jgi:hypothetical protein
MTASAKQRHHGGPAQAAYMPVQPHALRAADTFSVNLYVSYQANSEQVLCCRAGSRSDPAHLAELEAAGVELLYVQCDDFANFRAGLLESLESLLNLETVPHVEKFAALHIAVAVEIEHTLRLVDCTK